MSRGRLRNYVAAGMLTLCLGLMLPNEALARQDEASSHQVTYGIKAKVFLYDLWNLIESIWSKSSVLIVPDGSNAQEEIPPLTP